MMKAFFLAIVPLVLEAQVFSGGNATKLRGNRIANPLSCSGGQGIAWNASTSQWECGGTGGGGGVSTGTGATSDASITVTHSSTTAKTWNCVETSTGFIVEPSTIDLSSATQTVFNFSPVLSAGTTCYVNTGAGTASTMDDQTLVGNISGAPAIPIGLTATQVRTLTNTPSGATSLTTANALAIVASSGVLGQSTLKNNGGILYPTADSTTAVQFNKADGTTNVVTVDTTNGRVGIGTAAPSAPLHVVGGVKFGAATTADALADTLIATSATTQKGLVIQAKASQSANLQEWQKSDGTVFARIDTIGEYLYKESGNDGVVLGTGGLIMGSSGVHKFTSGTPLGTVDTSLSRIGPGIAGLGTGAAGSVAGTLQLTGLQHVTGTRPTCDSSNRGMTWYVGGGAGVADTYELCRKDTGDAYAWVTLF